MTDIGDRISTFMYYVSKLLYSLSIIKTKCLAYRYGYGAVYTENEFSIYLSEIIIIIIIIID